MPVEFIYILIFMIIFPVISFTGVIDCLTDRSPSVSGAFFYFLAAGISYSIGTYYVFQIILGARYGI